MLGLDRATSLPATRPAPSPSRGSGRQDRVLSQSSHRLDSSTTKTKERREITMTLYKRGDTWHAYIWIDGIRHHKPTGTTIRRKAETILRQYHDELNDARHRLPQLKPEMTFGELTARFIASGMAKPHSLDRLNYLLPFFSDMPLLHINVSAIRKYRQERHAQKTLTAATVNQIGRAHV